MWVRPSVRSRGGAFSAFSRRVLPALLRRSHPTGLPQISQGYYFASVPRAFPRAITRSPGPGHGRCGAAASAGAGATRPYATLFAVQLLCGAAAPSPPARRNQYPPVVRTASLPGVLVPLSVHNWPAVRDMQRVWRFLSA